MARESEKLRSGGRQMTVRARTAKAVVVGPGAPPAFGESWDQLDWAQVCAEVSRLQVRIAKATQVGRWNKVQALQRLLTRSHSGKLLAVKRVTENLGFRGVDADNPGKEIIHSGKFKSLTKLQRGWLKRRSAVEPVIGHL